jgi:hypothetical protein
VVVVAGGVVGGRTYLGLTPIKTTVHLGRWVPRSSGGGNDNGNGGGNGDTIKDGRVKRVEGRAERRKDGRVVVANDNYIVGQEIQDGSVGG